MSQPENEKRPGATAGSIALLVVGLLILVPSGLCTAFFMSAGNQMEGVALIFGGPFIVLGGWLVWLGIRKMRKPPGMFD